MQNRSGLGWLMTTLLAAIGAPAACGGSTDAADNGGSGGALGDFGQCTPVAGTSRWSGGFVECSEGYVHRATVAECPLPVERPPCDPSTAMTTGCTSDADCRSGPNGYCAHVKGAWEDQCHCAYNCAGDTDCAPGHVCRCQTSGPGNFFGSCVAAECTTDADCPLGQCRIFDTPCGATFTRCVYAPGPADSCSVDRDCGQGQMCGAPDATGKRSCAPAGCGGIGRPFLVAGTPRLAPAAARSDWTGLRVLPSVDQLGSSLRACLASAWTELGRMEHASIAAFARFTLELLAFGAPSDLVERSQAAMADETRHARLCFALASAYAGRTLGPGALAMNGVELALDIETSVLTAFIEGCIGETVAAAEAAECAASTTDPVVAAVLDAIAEDEARHAALAWRFVAWALGSSVPAERARILAELARAIDSAPGASSPASPRPVDLRRFGFLAADRRAELAREVLSQVVRPGLTALAGAQKSESLAQTAVGSASIAT